MFDTIGKVLDRYTTPSLHSMVARDAGKTKEAVLGQAAILKEFDGNKAFDLDTTEDVVEMQQAELPGHEGILYSGRLSFANDQVAGWVIKTEGDKIEEFRIEPKPGGTAIEYSELEVTDSYAGARSKLYTETPDGQFLINLPYGGTPGQR